MNSLAHMATWCASRSGVDSSTDELIFEIPITHIYAPTGKVCDLIRILRDNPARRFSSSDLAEKVGLLAKNIPRSLEIALNYGLISRVERGRFIYWQWA
jgi:predicted transcriptional regulator